MKLPCELIRDLLPLYAEHLTSPETGQLIEEHLQSCPACRDELHSIRLPVPVQADAQADAPLKQVHAALRKKQLLTILGGRAGRGVRSGTGRVDVQRRGSRHRRGSPVLDLQPERRLCQPLHPRSAGRGRLADAGRALQLGQPTVTVQAVRYRFPHFHAALAGVFGSAASSKTIAVSNTQLLAVVCADETLHYREGQPVSAYRLNGTIVYGTEQELGLYPRA